MNVAIVHDYLTQRGGAERVVLSLHRAFPDAPIYTSLYDPSRTFSAFRAVDVRTLNLNRLGFLRRHHRLALPVLAPAFSRVTVAADVVICSSSGWAHGVRVRGRKIVYCHAPARWLYQPERYFRGHGASRLALNALQSPLLEWDQRAAATADLYLTNSTAVQQRIRDVYGIEAQVLHPAHTVDIAGARQSVEGLAQGFFLCVSRLLPYKNVDAVLEAFAGMPEERLVVVGSGPEETRLRSSAPENVRLTGTVNDDELRWLYANCAGLVAASYEDFGMTPLEAAAFGKPAAVLRWGGFLDTVVAETGVFFDTPHPAQIREAVCRLRGQRWDQSSLIGHADKFNEERFIKKLAEKVDETRESIRKPLIGAAT